MVGPFRLPWPGLLHVTAPRSRWPCRRFVRARPGLYWYLDAGVGWLFVWHELYRVGEGDAARQMLGARVPRAYILCTSEEASRFCMVLPIRFVDALTGRLAW